MPKRDERTGLSPPATNHMTSWGLVANKGNLGPRHHVYAIDYYSSVVQDLPIFIMGPLLKYPLQDWTMNPQTNNNKRMTLPRTIPL